MPAITPQTVRRSSRRHRFGPTLYMMQALRKAITTKYEKTGETVQFVQLVISGIAQGCIYGLIALGFVLIYKATETVSFAQGELMMLGAFCGLALDDLAGLAVLAGGAQRHRAPWPLFGVLLERLVIRPILGQPAFSIVMLTIGIGYVARGLITMIPDIGTETHTLPVPYKDEVWNARRRWCSTSSRWW